MKTVDVNKYALEFVMGDRFDEYVQDSYWRRNFDSELIFDLMLHEANSENIILDGVENFDYDNFFHAAFEHMEKGLS